MGRYAYIIDKTGYLDEGGEDYRIEFTQSSEVIEIRVFSPMFEDYTGNNAQPMWLGADVEEVEKLRDFLNEFLEKKGAENGRKTK